LERIADARREDEELCVQLLIEAFPSDLQPYPLSARERSRWIARAMRAANGIGGYDPVIYFISYENDPTKVKIGYTTNLGSRLRSYRTGSPHEIQVQHVRSGSREAEQALHRKFANDHIKGEWFKRSVAILEYMSEAAPDVP
jgi:hypothetical protein